MKYQIFLGKAGKGTGPFTDEEITALKADGKISEYHWIWDTRSPGWQPLDPPPPAPVGVELPAARPATILMSPVVAARRPAVAPTIPDPLTIEAICHDFRNAVNGKICDVSDQGCDLVGRDPESGPIFSSNARVYLNLLDTDAGHSMNVTAQLLDIRRENGQWRYHLGWTQCPEILR